MHQCLQALLQKLCVMFVKLVHKTALAYKQKKKSIHPPVDILIVWALELNGS